ncbi:MAG TPA: ATP-dependent helicase, partial [Microbacteriaceae bacterium]|nr:ATP-dependent helicase [Microbacteriaceae bacterium]
MATTRKPAAGRAAKDFTPRKSAGKKLGGNIPKGATAGSRSPKHRGYRPDAEGETPVKKARWSAEERVAKGRFADRRDGGRGTRDADERPRRDGDARPPREHGTRDRVAGGVYARDTHEHSGRGGRTHVGGTRKPAAGRFDRDDRPARNFDRDDRAPRRDRDDRPARSFDRDERAPRRDRDDRPARSFDRDERAPRRDRDD